MTERGILFSAPMVRALLAGTKTQTRRAVKLPVHSGKVTVDPGGAIFGPGPYLKVEDTSPEPIGSIHPRIRCPYGYRGDRLWVRESVRYGASLDPLSPVAIGEKAVDAGYSKPWAPIRYEADEETRNASELRNFGTAWGKLRPGIHLPRWASRITLEVTEVRAQRLHDIDEDDARAEGAPKQFVIDAASFVGGKLVDFEKISTHRHGFAALWREINGDESWNSNPWVWAVTFKRVEAKA